MTSAETYRCCECRAIMVDPDAPYSVLCDACNETPAIHARYAGTAGCHDTSCGICHASIEASAEDDCREINFEWHTTRRGTYGLSHVVTPRTAGPALSTWIWLTDSGDAGQSGSKPMAMTEAYVSMVRAQNGRPAFPWVAE